MDDLTDDENARRVAAHARLVELAGHPTVQSVAAEALAGGLTFLQFFLKLAEVPEIAAGLKALSGGVDLAVGGAVTGATAPFLGPFASLAGSGAVALVHLASGALERAAANKAAGTSPGPTS